MQHQKKTGSWFTMRRRLAIIVFGTSTKAGKLFDILLLWLILASVILTMLDSIASFHQEYTATLLFIEWSFTILFTLEYLLRIWISRSPLNYILSFWGIIDLLAFSPTYIGMLFTDIHFLLIIRILRLLRIFRILKLTRYTHEARLLINALKGSSKKIIVFFAAVTTIVVIMGTLMYVVEGETNGFKSIPESIYWAVVTITTVGYGDITPQTFIGKLLSSLSMMMGYAIIAIPTGIMTVEIIKTSKTQDIKMHCPHCATTVSPSDIYCKQCGQKL